MSKIDAKSTTWIDGIGRDPKNFLWQMLDRPSSDSLLRIGLDWICFLWAEQGGDRLVSFGAIVQILPCKVTVVPVGFFLT